MASDCNIGPPLLSRVGPVVAHGARSFEPVEAQPIYFRGWTLSEQVMPDFVLMG